jgi:superfamily II DNA or RNA helicase
MPDIVHVTYAQTGRSSATDAMGMREMQERAFEARAAQYLLLKAPPASGKSRALMYIALDKLHRQGLKKVIVAVPERSIGASFASTDLATGGFFTDWVVPEQWNLCIPEGDTGKVQTFLEFLRGDQPILVCTHATLRFAFEATSPQDYDDVVLAIDEFHHVSADAGSRLGDTLRSVMSGSSAHVVAMTGSYFRGDSLPILLPDEEAKFTKVTYNYYEQLNGYQHLKSLGIGYHFYRNVYTTAIPEILNTDKKTILHIPHVGAGESTKDKNKEVGSILDSIGIYVRTDPDSGIIVIKRHGDGREIRVADLVNDTKKDRDKLVSYLRNIQRPEDVDLIIALGMAKEGFDWTFCEHALTVGYRGSLTEIIQIIGRCTRDSSNKSHAQFTNLIAQPDADDELVRVSVNNMLKAITCSLLMEQVIAPNFNFKSKDEVEAEASDPAGTIRIKGFKAPSTARVLDIIKTDLNDLKAAILQNDTIVKALPGNVDPEVINRVLIPRIIRVKYPDLSDQEVEEVRQYVVVDSAIKAGEIKEVGDKKFIRMAGQFVNIDDLHIDLIDSINPFQRAFEILSKSVTTHVLRAIQETIEATRLKMTTEEALLLWPKIKTFVRANAREPGINAVDPIERRLADALIYIKAQRRAQGV